MEHEKGAGQLQTGLGEPQDHSVRGQHDHRRCDVRHSLVAIVIELQNCTQIHGASMNISVKINVFISYHFHGSNTLPLKFEHTSYLIFVELKKKKKYLHNFEILCFYHCAAILKIGFYFQNVGYGRGATGLVLYVISFLTTVGNAMVLHAIRTERRLQTVSIL
jgi:hypothetical protein